MRIEELIKSVQRPATPVLNEDGYVEINIDFTADGISQSIQFDVDPGNTGELVNLWEAYCKESNIDPECITGIQYENYDHIDRLSCAVENFVVYIDSAYVRDAQLFVPEYPVSDEENIGELMGSDNNWNDSTKYGLFVGVFKWNESDVNGLRTYVAKKYDVFEGSLVCVPVCQRKMAPKNKCIKKSSGNHLYIKCTCGAEINGDIFYWSDYKYCPSCGTEICLKHNMADYEEE